FVEIREIRVSVASCLFNSPFFCHQCFCHSVPSSKSFRVFRVFRGLMLPFLVASFCFSLRFLFLSLFSFPAFSFRSVLFFPFFVALLLCCSTPHFSAIKFFAIQSRVPNLFAHFAV